MNSLRAFALTTWLSCTVGITAAVFGERDPSFHGGGGIMGDYASFSLLPDGSSLVNLAPYFPNGERNPAFSYLPPGQHTSDGRVLSWYVSGLPDGVTFLRQERLGSPQEVLTVQVAGEIKAVAENQSGLLIVGNFSAVAGVPRTKIAALDGNFNVLPLFGSTPSDLNYVSAVAVASDGAIIVGGASSTKPMLLRFFSDGAQDANFSPALPHNPSSTYEVINCVVLQSDGKFLISKTSTFYTIFVRLLPDGSLDTSFHTDKPIVSAVVQSDGRIVCRDASRCYRLNSDGTLDGTFVVGPIADLLGIDKLGNRYIKSFVGNGYLFPEGVVRLFPNGEVDLNYCRSGPIGVIRALFPEPGGSVIIAGNFQKFPLDDRSELKDLARRYQGGPTIMDRFGRDGIARLDKTGRVTAGFELGSGEYRSVIKMEKFGSGYLVLNKFNPRLARYTLDGQIDPTFQKVTADEFLFYSPDQETFAIQSDGKVLLSGLFFQFRGLGYPKMVRLNADGSVDPSFNLIGYQFTQGPNAILPMGDGQIYISSGSVIQRLSTAGAADPNLYIPFDNTFPNWAYIQKMIPSVGDTFWVAGNFLGVNGFPVRNLARISTSGAVLAQADGYEWWSPTTALCPLSDGGLLFSNGTRIRADGTISGNFQIGGTAIAMDQTGDIVVAGGRFLFAARLYGEASATPLVFNLNTLSDRWLISGYPGSQVEIESSQDLIDWRTDAALTLTNGQAAFDVTPSISNSFFRARLHK